jgi:hypothetical protein
LVSIWPQATSRSWRALAVNHLCVCCTSGGCLAVSDSQTKASRTRVAADAADSWPRRLRLNISDKNRRYIGKSQPNGRQKGRNGRRTSQTVAGGSHTVRLRLNVPGSLGSTQSFVLLTKGLSGATSMPSPSRRYWSSRVAPGKAVGYAKSRRCTSGVPSIEALIAADANIGLSCSLDLEKFRKMASVDSGSDALSFPVWLPNAQGRRSFQGSEWTRKTLDRLQNWIHRT